MANGEIANTLEPHPNLPGSCLDLYNYYVLLEAIVLPLRANLGTYFKFQHFLLRLHSWFLLAVLLHVS